jgi:hypothetical protein
MNKKILIYLFSFIGSFYAFSSDGSESHDKIKNLETLKNIICVLDVVSGCKDCSSSLQYASNNSNYNELKKIEGWEKINLGSLKKAINRVPLQADLFEQMQTDHSDEVNQKIKDYQVSCGPISVSIALNFFTESNDKWEKKERDYSWRKKDWAEFVKSFPYFLSGVLPKDLEGHANKKIEENEIGDIAVNLHFFSNFEKTLKLIMNEIRNGSPVTVLLVPAVFFQHYVNIIGFNDNEKKIAILDPSGKLKIRSYDWLSTIMYAGISKQMGTSFLLESLFIFPLWKLFAEFGSYNILTYSKKTVVRDGV